MKSLLDLTVERIYEEIILKLISIFTTENDENGQGPSEKKRKKVDESSKNHIGMGKD